MKRFNKISLLLISIVFFFFGCNKETKHDGYIISGTSQGVKDDLVTLVLTDLINKKDVVIDTAHVMDGKFQFKGKIDSPDQVSVVIGEQRSKPFFIENNNISVNLKSSQFPSTLDVEVKGSNLQDQWIVFNAQIDSINNDKKYKALNDLYKVYNEAGRNRNVKLQEELYKKFDDYKELLQERSDRIAAMRRIFLKNNPNSPIVPEIMNFLFSDRTPLNEIEELINTFQGEAKQTHRYKYFLHKYEIRKRTDIGQTALNFTLKNEKGNDVSLSDFKGKYVLLDFWASWCKPCRASYPHLKKVYNKYKDQGFEVLAISTDSKPVDWLKAIEEDQTVWTQVIDRFPEKRGPAEISELYSVPFLPTTYLLDKEGVILAKNLHADELDEKLEDIFGF